jgi:hypothetical protein
MNPNTSSIAIPEPDIVKIRKTSGWPDKVFRTIDLLPQYITALTTWDDMPFLRHDELAQMYNISWTKSL